MELKGRTIGFALTGSFCTFNEVFPQIENLIAEGANIVPIMSEIAVSTDTRFGAAKDFIKKLEELTEKRVISSIKEAEPIGPQGLLDILILAPCTGNTLSKISNSITDSCVAMAAKAHLRNERPLVIAVSTNDGLGASAKNIGTLLARKNIYFVPFIQDDPINKPNSLVAKMDKIIPTAIAALNSKQIQPLLG